MWSPHPTLRGKWGSVAGAGGVCVCVCLLIPMFRYCEGESAWIWEWAGDTCSFSVPTSEAQSPGEKDGAGCAVAAMRAVERRSAAIIPCHWPPPKKRHGEFSPGILDFFLTIGISGETKRANFRGPV